MLSTEKPYSLDITDYKFKRDLIKPDSEVLAEYIYKEVQATQSVVVRALPNKLIVTKKQYDILTKTPQMMAMPDYYDTGQEFYLYRTPLNVMEVEIAQAK